MPTDAKPSKDLDKRERIVKRIARELRDGFYVNLGIGLPTLIANYVPPGMDVILQSENGMLGIRNGANQRTGRMPGKRPAKVSRWRGYHGRTTNGSVDGK